jgi:hypothetical protein
MRFAGLLLGGVTLLAGGDWLYAFAPPPGDDLLGIYTAPDGSGNDNIYATGLVEVYLLITGTTTSDAICSWECSIGIPLGVALTSVQLQGQAANLIQPPGFAVMLATGLEPVGGVAHLATLEFEVPEGRNCLVLASLQELDRPGFPAGSVGAYGVCGELGVPHWLFPSSGDPGACVFGFNTGPLGIVVVSASGSSWGAIKHLYR